MSIDTAGIAAIVMAILAIIKDQLNHNSNKTRLANLTAYLCGKAPTCPDKIPAPIVNVTPPTTPKV